MQRAATDLDLAARRVCWELRLMAACARRLDGHRGDSTVEHALTEAVLVHAYTVMGFLGQGTVARDPALASHYIDVAPGTYLADQVPGTEWGRDALWQAMGRHLHPPVYPGLKGEPARWPVVRIARYVIDAMRRFVASLEAQRSPHEPRFREAVDAASAALI